MTSSPIVLRTARAGDDAALARLAALDRARPLPGAGLVAEAGGALVAALCLSTGRAVADPFAPTLHIVGLLRKDAERRRMPSVTLRVRPPLARLALRR